MVEHQLVFVVSKLVLVTYYPFSKVYTDDVIHLLFSCKCLLSAIFRCWSKCQKRKERVLEYKETHWTEFLSGAALPDRNSSDST